MGEEVPRDMIALYADMLKPEVTEITKPEKENTCCNSTLLRTGSKM
jgi:hypothetical protein